MKKIVIAAVAKNGIIGRSNGEMPWHSKPEFQHFKSTTIGFPIIMGRITFESLGNPLKGRLNIVISKSKELKIPLLIVASFGLWAMLTTLWSPYPWESFKRSII